MKRIEKEQKTMNYMIKIQVNIEQNIYVLCPHTYSGGGWNTKHSKGMLIGSFLTCNTGGSTAIFHGVYYNSIPMDADT